MKPRNPWQELLVKHINHLSAPPRPEGYLTRYEIAKLWGLKMNTATRILKDMVKDKKLEERKHLFVIQTKSKPALRQLKVFKILPLKHPRK